MLIHPGHWPWPGVSWYWQTQCHFAGENWLPISQKVSPAQSVFITVGLLSNPYPLICVETLFRLNICRSCMSFPSLCELICIPTILYLEAIRQHWLLIIFLILFWIDLWTLRDGVWCRHPIYGWAVITAPELPMNNISTYIFNTLFAVLLHQSGCGNSLAEWVSV